MVMFRLLEPPLDAGAACGVAVEPPKPGKDGEMLDGLEPGNDGVIPPKLLDGLGDAAVSGACWGSLGVGRLGEMPDCASTIGDDGIPSLIGKISIRQGDGTTRIKRNFYRFACSTPLNISVVHNRHFERFLVIV